MRYLAWGTFVAAWFVAGCSCGGTGDLPPGGDEDSGMGGGDSGNEDAGPMPGVDTGPMPGVDAGPMCTDADGDGVTTCAGDCDDSDATTYPGAPEVCGDGLTNDCSMNPADTGCMGIGTYVAPPPLGQPAPMGRGTQAQPVDTITQGIANAVTIGGGVDVYVAAGTYNEEFTMVEGVSVLGGHDPAAGWSRDPATNVSMIDTTTAAGILFPTGITRVTELDGFTLRGARSAVIATTITVMNGASPTIANNDIGAPNTMAASIGIDVNPVNSANTATPLIENNRIRMGTSRTGWGGSNGAFGIRANQTAVELRSNRVDLAADPTIQQAIVVGGSPPMAIIDRNVVRGTGRADFAFALRIGGSNAIVTNNDFDPGNANGTRGIATGGRGFTQRFENNVVFGGNASGRSIAFAIEYEGMVPTPPPEIDVHSNFFHGGSGGGSTFGVSVGECPPGAFAVGRFTNNIIYAGSGATRYAFAEDHPNVDPASLRNNALFRMPGGTGALYRDEGLPGIVMCVPGGVGSNVNTAMGVNALPGNAGNIEDGCAVVDPRVDGDMHLGPTSMCIDAGDPMGAPATDFEGDARPLGARPDIGADEAG